MLKLGPLPTDANDPARDVAGVILMQLLPFADPDCLDVFAAFERSIYATLDARSHAA